MPAKYDLTDEDVTELNPQDVGVNAAADAGLPDTPGKSRARNRENVETAPPNGDAPDSMTEAVMENLRVGAGSGNDADDRTDVVRGNRLK